MYRVAFLKQKVGSLHDQEIYRLNACSLSESDSTASSPDFGMPECPVIQEDNVTMSHDHVVDLPFHPGGVERAGSQVGSLRSTMSLSSDSDFLEDNETTRRMHQEIRRLSPEARVILKQTFHTMENRPIRCGLNIMIALFSEFPHYKNIWPQFRQIPDSSLMNAPELTKHAAIYMRGLRTIIENLDDDDRITKALRKIAHAHVKWGIYKKHIIHMLGPVLDQVQAYNGMTPEIKDAWTVLYDVIANLIDIFRESEAANVRHIVAQTDRAAVKNRY
uniref:Globin family profile domain-containing protein n=1 Tax=Panagrolaimus sp. JU765 TaxID=591449 RepID=A0AC34QAH0_9BILA